MTPAGEVLHENAAVISRELAPAVHDPQRGVFVSKLFFDANDIQPAMKRCFGPARSEKNRRRYYSPADG